MIHIMKYCLLVLFFIVSFYPFQPLFGADHSGQNLKSSKDASASQKLIFLPMPEPGKKVPIGSGYYLIYGFDKRPRLGTVIMKVEVFTAEGKKETALKINAEAGMPSMSGAHDTGNLTFTLSKKGDYLLPVNIVMPGDWEIRLTVIKERKVIFRGRYNFDV